MPIGPVTMFGIYIVVWWTVLLGILPLGTSKEVHEPPTDGAQWGAPKTPNLKRKFITTTWVSAIVWAFVMLLVFTGWLPLPNFSQAPAL